MSWHYFLGEGQTAQDPFSVVRLDDVGHPTSPHTQTDVSTVSRTRQTQESGVDRLRQKAADYLERDDENEDLLERKNGLMT